MEESLSKPIVLHPGWREVPEHLIEEIMIQRRQQAERGEKGEATDAEILAYLYTASLAAPMDHEYVNIYMHLLQKYLDQKKIERPDFLREDVELSEYEQGLLRELRRWIWSRAERAWKKNRKKLKKQKCKIKKKVVA